MSAESKSFQLQRQLDTVKSEKLRVETGVCVGVCVGVVCGLVVGVGVCGCDISVCVNQNEMSRNIDLKNCTHRTRSYFRRCVNVLIVTE